MRIAQACILRQLERRDDVLTGHYMEFPTKLLRNFFLPALLQLLADFACGCEHKNLHVAVVFLGTARVRLNLVQGRRDRTGKSLAQLSGRETGRSIGIQTKIFLAFARDEFGPTELCQNHSESLKSHPFLVGHEFIQCEFDHTSQNGHASSCLPAT